MIRLKSERDIEALRAGGSVLASILDELEQLAQPGVRLVDLDEVAQRRIAEHSCIPAFLNYAPDGHEPFPAALCTSVNAAVVHGLPNETALVDGDVVGLDLGLIYKEKYYLDSARTVGVGVIADDVGRLISTTKEALARGIAAAQPGATTGDVGAAVQGYAEGEGYGVVRQLVGHGVGFDVHEAPQVPNYGKKGEGERLVPGLVIAIEPMLTIGKPEVKTDRDGWGIVSKDGSLTAHQEHTVAITESGPEILTRVMI